MDPAPAGTRRHLSILVLLCVALYWLGLGASGFSSSEGNRVVPGWEALETGEWLVTRMFGQAYVRKPPGMPWAVAASAAIFGKSEFSARAVSALSISLGVLLTWWFARRWLGASAALWAALAHALMPVFWPPGRSAEIESLHNLGVQAACLGALGMAIAPCGGRPARVTPPVLLASGLVLAGLAKGPAGVPCVVAAIIAGCACRRSARPMASPALWGAIAAAGVVLGAIGWVIWARLRELPETPVAQGPGEFLWDARRLWHIALLIPAGIVAGLPATLALPAPFLARWRSAPGAAPGADAARALALATIVALALYNVLGVSNPRYVMPALTLAAGVAGWTVARLCARPGAAGARTARRAAAAAVLVAGAGIVHAGVMDRLREPRSGRAMGAEIAAVLPPGAEVWADGVIDDRPDVLLYAVRAGTGIRPRWKPGLAAGLPPRPGTYVLVREDSGRDEWSRMQAWKDRTSLQDVGGWTLRKMHVRLILVGPGMPPGDFGPGEVPEPL